MKFGVAEVFQDNIYMLIELLTSEMEHPHMKALKSFSTELKMILEL